MQLRLMINQPKADRLLTLFEKAWLPKPFVSNLEWAVANALVTNQDLLANVTPREVPIKRIEPTQLFQDAAVVDKYAQEGRTSGGIGFERNGRVYLYDGHHRLFAAIKRGLPTTEIHVVDLPDYESSRSEGSVTLDQFARDILKVDKRDILGAMDSDDRRVYESRSPRADRILEDFVPYYLVGTIRPGEPDEIMAGGSSGEIRISDPRAAETQFQTQDAAERWIQSNARPDVTYRVFVAQRWGYPRPVTDPYKVDSKEST